MKWSESAKTALQAHIRLKMKELVEVDADPREVEEDLMHHISEEAKLQGRDFVTVEDVEAVVGVMAQTENHNGQMKTNVDKTTSFVAEENISHAKNWTLVWTMLLGVFVPFVAYLLELTTGACSNVLFDPMPSSIHVFGVGAVIAVNIYSWNLVRKVDKERSYKRVLLINAAVCGMCSYFMIQFIHVAPFALMGSIFLIGLLPLSPYFSFFVALRFRSFLPSEEKKHFLKMALLGFFIVFVADIPRLVTYTTIGSIKSASDISQSKVDILRTIGDDGILEDLCSSDRFNNMGSIYRIVLGYDSTNQDMAQKVYYLVTGEGYKTISNSNMGRGRRGRRSGWDQGQGGDAVGEYIEDLNLFSSRFDSSVDADGGVVYTEWTMEFQNNHKYREREARSRIMLPDGGVVSRLTLWIDGEEREAAFAGKGQVVRAYKSVVRRRRDPVLVTTSGDNQVRMQCYPVPENGGKMKLRIGITTPLQIKNSGEVYFSLPIFSDRNFVIDEKFSHHLWIEGANEIALGDSTSAKKGNGRFRLIKEVTHLDLLKDHIVYSSRHSKITNAWFEDKNGKTIVQFIDKGLIEKRISAIVIDGSVSMKDFKRDVYDSLRKLKNKPQRIYQVGGTSKFLAAGDISSIVKHDYEGGYDNLPTLKEAWKFANDQGGAVMWIHGAQPVEISPISALKQILDRDERGTPFYDFPVGNKQNLISESIDGATNYHVVRGGLGTALKKYCGDTEFHYWNRSILPSTQHSADMYSKQTSDHLLRLWVNDEVKRLLAAKKVKEATKLASNNHIVTPVTGAVVLESKSQYDANNLTPVDGEEVPTIPEPETWLMIILGLLFFYFFFYRKKRTTLCTGL